LMPAEQSTAHSPAQSTAQSTAHPLLNKPSCVLPQFLAAPRHLSREPKHHGTGRFPGECVQDVGATQHPQRANATLKQSTVARVWCIHAEMHRDKTCMMMISHSSGPKSCIATNSNEWRRRQRFTSLTDPAEVPAHRLQRFTVPTRQSSSFLRPDG
jgi:hypothetical protein